MNYIFKSINFYNFCVLLLFYFFNICISEKVNASSRELPEISDEGINRQKRKRANSDNQDDSNKRMRLSVTENEMNLFNSLLEEDIKRKERDIQRYRERLNAEYMDGMNLFFIAKDKEQEAIEKFKRSFEDSSKSKSDFLLGIFYAMGGERKNSRGKNMNQSLDFFKNVQACKEAATIMKFYHKTPHYYLDNTSDGEYDTKLKEFNERLRNPLSEHDYLECAIFNAFGWDVPRDLARSLFFLNKYFFLDEKIREDISVFHVVYMWIYFFGEKIFTPPPENWKENFNMEIITSIFNLKKEEGLKELCTKAEKVNFIKENFELPEQEKNFSEIVYDLLLLLEIKNIEADIKIKENQRKENERKIARPSRGSIRADDISPKMVDKKSEMGSDSEGSLVGSILTSRATTPLSPSLLGTQPLSNNRQTPKPVFHNSTPQTIKSQLQQKQTSLNNPSTPTNSNSKGNPTDTLGNEKKKPLTTTKA